MLFLKAFAFKHPHWSYYHGSLRIHVLNYQLQLHEHSSLKSVAALMILVPSLGPSMALKILTSLVATFMVMAQAFSEALHFLDIFIAIIETLQLLYFAWVDQRVQQFYNCHKVSSRTVVG